MATAKKLPSGSYRVRVFDYQDEDGKKHYKSFTAPTKKAAELMAAQWSNNRDERKKCDITVPDAIKRYIESKEGVLSPATVPGYEGMLKRYFSNNDDIKSMKMSELSNERIQLWISNLSRKVSPKTVSNALGLLSPSIAMFAPSFQLRVTLPERKSEEMKIPSEAEFKEIIKYFSERVKNKKKAQDMIAAIYLAAFGPMRRGEIAALTDKDLNGNVISVNKDMVLDKNDCWVIKNTPKTDAGNRKIEYPGFVIDLIRDKEGSLVDANPNQIYDRWAYATKELGMNYRFHDLRHYGASYMHAKGISEKVIMDRGGWASDAVMKRIYRHQITEESRKQTDILMESLSEFKPE